MEFKHKSVLLEETIEGLDIKPDGIYVDGTLGGAGHAGEACRRFLPYGKSIQPARSIPKVSLLLFP